MAQAALRADIGDTYQNALQRATLAHGEGRLDEAEQLYGMLLEEPQAQVGVLHYVLGMLHAQKGDNAAALNAYDRARWAGFTAPDLYLARADLLRQADRPLEALESYERAIALGLGSAPVHNKRGVVLEGLGETGAAIAAYDAAIALDPSHAYARHNKGSALLKLERYDDAIRSFDDALTLNPAIAEAWNLMGMAFEGLSRHDEAITDYEAALALRPAYAGAILNRGGAREALGDAAGALADFETARRLEPTLPDAAFNMALIHLREGDYLRGFALYETRWLKPQGPHRPYPRETLWTGEQEVAGQTVLLHAEQGFGDVIQFCRFAADVAGMGARVILRVQAPLVRLFANLAGPAEVISVDEPTPPFDLYSPLMSLPRVLGLGAHQVDRGAYLSAPTPLSAAWAARLSGLRRPRIGLAWSGNPGHENDHNRSMALADLAPLFELPADLISLQKEFRAADLAILDAGASIHRFDAALDDFCDTASLIDQCDAVVAVDTAIAHLAGAMGKPVMLLLPRHADWRWMSGRSDSPWYPSARLFRQTQFGDWSGPVVEVAAALRQV